VVDRYSSGETSEGHEHVTAPADPTIFCGSNPGEQGATALNGPSGGTPKTTLCEDLLRCLHATSCFDPEGSELECYCGANGPGGCNTPTGACKTQIAAAMETNDSSAIVGNFNDNCLANGAAFDIYTVCDANCCPEECLGMTPDQTSADPTFCNAGTGPSGAAGSSGAALGL